MKNFTYRKLITEIYDKRATIPFDGSTNKKTILKDIALTSSLLPDTTKNLLDIGCGAGWHLEKFSELDYKSLTGIDLSRKSLENFTNRFDTSKIILINADFLTHEFSNTFNCVTNFFSCVGHFEPTGDKAFFEKVFNVLDRKGIFVLTIFTIDKIQNLEGNYKVKYSEKSDKTVWSKVSFNEDTRKLKINQNFAGKIIEEKMTLYNEVQVISFFKEANFSEVKVLRNYSDYISTFIGYR